MEGNNEFFLDCAKRGQTVDIMTVDSIVYVSAHCGEDSVALRVPNFITIAEIKSVCVYSLCVMQAILQVLNYEDNEIGFAIAKLSELDGTKSVFYYKLGSLNPPEDFEDLETESIVESCARRHV